MDETLHDGQHLLIDKLTPRFDSYSRGDIVVLHPPDQEESSTPYIKRVIGVAGDHVELHDGGVWVNGVELDEPYVAPGAMTEPLTEVRLLGRRARRGVRDGRQPRALGRLTRVRGGGDGRDHRPRLAALLAARHARPAPDADLSGCCPPLSAVDAGTLSRSVALAQRRPHGTPLMAAL